jgi:hypothetical protein
MFVMAEVKCYYCGYVSGDLLVDTARRGKVGVFRPVDSQTHSELSLSQPLRCSRCGGPTYLDEVERVRERRLPDAPRPAEGRSKARLR